MQGLSHTARLPFDALIRIATGSATVATITGAGSLSLPHANDASFWMIKQHFGMSVGEIFKIRTAMETPLSVAGLVLILLLSLVIRAHQRGLPASKPTLQEKRLSTEYLCNKPT